MDSLFNLSEDGKTRDKMQSSNMLKIDILIYWLVVPRQAKGRSFTGERTQKRSKKSLPIEGAGPDLMWCDVVGCEVKQGDVRLGGGRLWG